MVGTLSNSSIPIADNDHLSEFLSDFVPDDLQGTDHFLDVITWNIKFFNTRDPKRVEQITNIMQELNADLFVLQEIEAGSLDKVAQSLTEAGAGLYKVVYGTTGGDLRVAFMYDMEWVKASTDIEEIFTDNPTVVVGTGRGSSRKAVFPRLPLYGKFVVRAIEEQEGELQEDPFDFELIGVHLKSQRGGGREQRSEAARLLADWLLMEATDEDVIIAGDWNAPADRPEWEAIQELEEQKILKFAGFHDDGEGSHLRVGGQRSRLDFIAVTHAIADAIEEKSADENNALGKSVVIEWNALLKNQRGQRTRKLLEEIIGTISDHLPVLTRFYFTDKD
ncbi:endonuclease/exonuclease/phosphatase family protein [Gloeocapsopsis crepidinum LEGE 06123]|uniref:Endonuclease/exonuclease/phosphatase family protein n=1 Tax=Gloeocapsopsis crepidinum LEGE 06123 TaxID=588587 RepID=A0ABR9UV27_9CHRO|nr:endonuclease/exonuclease/phosphatase family protein [Gloeocapsopsis crepidinum]MBE9191900.1 endonuclease/exonuclease/phosphatase family protein [Gloeocapsopsis crepidinum LEGE 06123]